MNRLLLALLLTMGSSAFAQVNYVLNPDFEAYTYCPQQYDEIKAAKFWSGVDSVKKSTCNYPDYCNSCATPGISSVYVPSGSKYYQYPRSGNGFAQIVLFCDSPLTSNAKDYLQGRLYKKLQNGKSYCVSFYVNFAEASKFAIKEISAYLDNGLIDTTETPCMSQTQYLPQITYVGNIISDTTNWIRITGSFIANGTEQFITIGNFKDKAHTTYMQMPYSSWNNSSSIAIYLIDDVSVIESPTVADAGPDKHVGKGDSIYIGKPKEVGLECTWSILGSTTEIGKGAGIWVKPAATTSYVVTQTLCGNVTRDTVRVEVWAAGVHSINGQSQQYTLMPNPNDGAFEISQSFANNESLVAEVRNMLGERVYQATVRFSNGKASLDAGSQLAPGLYYLSLKDSRGNVWNMRFVRE